MSCVLLSDKNKAAGIISFIVFCVVIYLAQVLSQGLFLSVSNWFVPDGFNYLNRLNDLGGSLSSFGSGKSQAVYVINIIPFRLVGSFGFFIVNMVLVLWMVFRVRLAVFFVFPFFLLSLALPSKDLLMLVFVVEWSVFLVKRFSVIVLLFIAGVYFIRDGDVFVLLACSIAVLLYRRGVPWQVIASASIIASGLLFAFGKRLLAHIPVFVAYYGQYSSKSWIGCCSLTDYFIRFIGNASNLAMRQVFVDVLGGISLIAVLYFISGVWMFTALCMALYSFIKNDSRTEVVIPTLLLLVALATLSVNPFVQPRYFLPYAGAYFVLNKGMFSRKEWMGALLVSLILTGIGINMYGFLPIPKPPIPSTGT